MGALLFIFTLILNLRFSLGWDECMYMVIAESLVKNPLNFMIQGVPSLHKPPFLPYYLSLFFRFNVSSEFLARFLVDLLNVLLFLTIFYLVTKLFNESIGLYTSFFLFSSPLIIFFGGKVLSDVVGAFFCTISFLFFLLALRYAEKIYFFATGIFLGLSFVSRYTNYLLGIVLAILFLSRKKLVPLRKPGVWLPILSFLFFLVPFFFLNLQLYGDPFKGPYFASRLIQMDIPVDNLTYLSWFPIYVGVHVLLLSFLTFKEREKTSFDVFALWAWIIIYVTATFFLLHKEERFVLPVVPFFCVLAAYSIEKLKIKHKKKFLTIILLLSSFYMASTFVYVYCFFPPQMDDEIKETGEYLKHLTHEGEEIMSELRPQLIYYAKRKIVLFPRSIDLFWREVSSGKVRFIVVNYFRPSPPPYIQELIRGGVLSLERAFYDETGVKAIEIYRLNTFISK